jgi:hypothetical protein
MSPSCMTDGNIRPGQCPELDLNHQVATASPMSDKGQNRYGGHLDHGGGFRPFTVPRTQQELRRQGTGLCCYAPSSSTGWLWSYERLLDRSLVPTASLNAHLWLGVVFHEERRREYVCTS